jgi:hypothetical protein
MRKIGVLASGQTPSAPEAADALEALRLMYEEMVGNGVFGRQADVAVPDGTANFTARENRRYTVEDLANVTITLPTFIEDRWWLWQWPWEWGPMPIADQEPYTGVRPPLDRNVVRVADLASTQRRLFVYDSAIARWVSLLDLDLTDEAPLSTRYGAGLQAILGVKLSSEYGVDVPAATGLEAGRCQSALAMRLDGPATIVPGTYF